MIYKLISYIKNNHGVFVLDTQDDDLIQTILQIPQHEHIKVIDIAKISNETDTINLISEHRPKHITLILIVTKPLSESMELAILGNTACFFFKDIESPLFKLLLEKNDIQISNEEWLIHTPVKIDEFPPTTKKFRLDEETKNLKKFQVKISKEECINCGACLAESEVFSQYNDEVKLSNGEFENQYLLDDEDYDRITCAKDICPVECITLEKEVSIN